MAEAYGETGDYSYAQYTFDGSLDPAYTKAHRSVTLYVTDIDRTRDGLEKTLVISYDSTKMISK